MRAAINEKAFLVAGSIDLNVFKSIGPVPELRYHRVKAKRIGRQVQVSADLAVVQPPEAGIEQCNIFLRIIGFQVKAGST